MPKKKSDALQALIAEQVDFEVAYQTRAAQEDAASQESVAARQALDAAIEKRKIAHAYVERTREAISVLQLRDDISAETLDALLTRERAR